MGRGPEFPSGVVVYTITVNTPDIRTSAFPTINLSENTTSDWLQFVTGNGSPILTLDAPNGFRYLPTSSLYFRIDAFAGLSNLGNVASTVTISPVEISVSPALANPLTILNYVPFNYSFSIPDTVIDVALSSSGTSSSLTPYLATDGSNFSSDIGFISAISNAPFSLTPVIGNVSVGSPVTSTVSSALSVITMTPDVPSRSLYSIYMSRFHMYLLPIPKVLVFLSNS